MIDDEGRLFGVVNVIDALVVLLVLAVLIAGVALLNPFASTETAEQDAPLETAERYATIDLGEQRPFVAEQISAGDVTSSSDVTVTDVYVGPASGSNVSVTARVRINGSLAEDGNSFRYLGDGVRQGGAFTLETDEYTANGTITRLDTEGVVLGSDTTAVVLRTTVSNTVANAIDIDDTFNLAGRSIATVQAANVYPTSNDSTRRVLLGLDLETVTRESGAYFGGDRAALGSTIPFETDRYELSGEVIGRDAYVPNGSVTTETISVKVENVDPEFADGIEVGMVEESMDEPTAEIVDKRTEPATVILTSDDGNIYERTHPRNEDVYLTVDATVRETASGYQFHAQSLKEGDTITLDFGTITVRGTVTDI
ncbi:Uncharacterized protein HSR121_0756 [Halapricum desulfuricans]|uniref:DUF4330 family protein n=1 Tax=Halapricum desulfuricans TaxID=2841257 RepID=A0A897MSK5_9EURY|nr:Uncharacterized protein HSR121_0756 [Halapricum desulfuricans]